MNDFLGALPWRLASLSALIVAALSAMSGADAWTSIERCGLAFAAFWCLGSLARALLRAADPRAGARGHARRGGDPLGRG